MEHTDVVVPTDFSVPEEPGSIAEAVELGYRIGATLQKGAVDVLEAADLCALASGRHGSRGLSVLCRAAHIERTKFFKLCVIGRDERLRRIDQLLPPSFSTIHLISQLDDKTFDAAVQAGIIHPNVRRGEIEALRKSRNSNEKVTHAAELPRAVEEMTAGGRYEIMVPKDIDAGRFAQVKQTLGALNKKFGIEIVSMRALIDSRDPARTPDPDGSLGEPADR